MSRRRSREPTPRPAQHGVHPSDRHVSVDLIDLGAHRLVRCRRYFDDIAGNPLEFAESTVGENVTMGTAGPEDEPTGLWFECKTCRDQGFEWRTVAVIESVRRALHELWIGQAQSDAPQPRERDIQLRADPSV